MTDFQRKYEAQIEELRRAANRLAEVGFVTSQGGNLSLRADDDVVLITPTKVAKLSITFEDICAVDMQGKVLYAKEGRKPTGEWPFHVRIMNRRPDVRGIVHAHPPILTGFAIAGGDWLKMPFLPEPAIEVGPMVMVPYAEPLSDQLAENFEAVIERSNGFLMENHGALMVSSEGIWRALEFLEMMEAAGKSIIVAKLLGNPKPIPPADVKNLENVIRTRNMPMPGLPGAVGSLTDIFV
ncbi:class II aldolase/adducin family protein [Bacillota bacterium Meth-B3]|nr:class II aldolase/adducin family protein [Christensenellaceae bacterium]MEA5070138.1 class II aldolase/adducin family protein [Christensenellaceae bacterium]